MSALEIAWGMSLIAAMWLVPVAAVRVLAYRSGEIDHTRTMRIAATVAATLAGLAVACLAVTSLLLVG